MRKLITIVTICLIAFYCKAQPTILPGDKSIDKLVIKPGLTTMGYYFNNFGQMEDVGTYEIEISTNNKVITVNSTLYFNGSNKQWRDTCIVNADTYKPISYSSDRDDKKFNIKFATSITGEYFNKKRNQKKAINEKPNGEYFDINIYPHILKTLPLKFGYQAIIPVYDYQAPDKTKLYNVIIRQVINDVYTSTLTGDHAVWRVSVFEESTGHKFDYLIDKKSRRIWHIIISSKEGQSMTLTDKESDNNPLKLKFDKEATVKLISKGSSIITGQVFGRVNLDAKQYANKGDAVYLIPYTPWYQEYYRVNKQLKKEGRKYNMPKDALECILVTTVYDDKGHFEFRNILPGEYIIYCQFEFVEKYQQNVVVGRTDRFVNNTYQGSTDITQTNRWSQLEYAFSEELVTITKDGEIKNLKMKKDNKSRFF
jgi:hypothetical protein